MTANGFDFTVSNDGIATVRMCKGENRIRMSYVDGWNTALDQVESNSDVKSIIITGTGKFFSNGFDLSLFETLPKDEIERTVLKTFTLYRRIALLPLTTVAAINGHAYGAGTFIAMACDYRVIRSDRGWMCFPEVQLDMEFDEFSCELLRTKVGTGVRIRDSVICGKKLTAQEALNFQLIDEALSSEHLEHAAVSLIKSAIGKSGFSRQALGHAKRDVYASLVQTNISLSKL